MHSQSEHAQKKGMPLHTKILIGLLLGAMAGVSANMMAHGSTELTWVVDNVANPIGQIILRMLFMVVIPLVFTSVALGVASLGDVRRIGRVGSKTLLYFLFTTGIAVVVGLSLVNVLQPGATCLA